MDDRKAVFVLCMGVVTVVSVLYGRYRRGK